VFTHRGVFKFPWQLKEMVMLQDRAMLVTLSIRQWTARKYDRRISSEVEKQYDTYNAGRYNKILIAEEAIKIIQKVGNQARMFHYENTLPWNDNGERILPAKNYLDYTGQVQELKGQFELASSKFVDNYEEYKQEAKNRLKGMFDKGDYPSCIEDRYSFEVRVFPIPDASDFRVSLESREVEKIREQIENRVKEAEKEAMRDLWQRLYEVVRHMVEKLQVEDSVFRNSLVENIAGLCQLLPKLNVSDDMQLEEKRKEIERALIVDPDSLRENKSLRKRTARNAEAILDSMAGYIGGAE